MSDTVDDLPDDVTDEPFRDVVNRATKRFKRVQQWESTARQRWERDYKFANGDDENNYQWPDDIYNSRTGIGSERPTLTINKVRQHNLLISNDAKQHKQGIKYRPVGGGATRDAADVLEGIARHIQNISHAQDVRGKAIDFQVEAGLGFTRIVTEYVTDDGFDQEIYIKGIDDPLSCYLYDYTLPDGSDAKAGFIFADRPRDEMEAKYPWLKGKAAPSNAVDGDDAGWVREDFVRECEYYEVAETQDELLGDSSGATILRSELESGMVKQWEDELEEKGEKLRRRKVTRRNVHWYLIVGDRVVDDAPWAGSTVPIVPWVGQETVINQQLDRKGHTRYLKSAQRMLNYNRSAAVEFGALQSKSPYIAAADSIEGYETYWESANIVNHSVLPFKHRDEQGRDIPPPARQQPPQSAPVFMEGAQAADNDMMIASGQYQAELGAPGNEISGNAINARQRQGDRATYHFIDNQAIAIRREGSIILEIVAKIYDTSRVVRILSEDGTESKVQVDPNASQAHQGAGSGESDVSGIFNPNVGLYEVVSDVGPDYATQRQEAFNAIVQILTQAPQLIDKIGDLLFKVADFPLADKIAERLKPGLPPEAQAAITQLQQQLQNGNKMLGEAMQALAEERLKNKAKDSDTVVKAFDADTRRLAALKDYLPYDPVMLRQLIREEMAQAAQDNLGPATQGAAVGINLAQAGQPPPGAGGQLPIRVPDPGEQAAMVGGM